MKGDDCGHDGLITMDANSTNDLLIRGYTLAEKYLVDKETAIVAIDSDQKIQYINRYGLELLRYTLDDLFQCNWSDLSVSVERGEETEILLAKILESPSEGSIVYKDTLSTRDGKTKRFSWRITAVLDDSGGAVGAILAGEVIDGPLYGDEAVYSTIVNGGSDGVIIVKDLKVVFANQKIAEITGYGLEEVDKINLKEITPPEHYKRAASRFIRRMKGEDLPPALEMEIFHKDGHRIPIELNNSRIEYGGGPASVIYIRDISDRKKAEEGAKKNKEMYKFLYDNNHAINLVIGSNGTILDLNPAAVRLLGYDQEEIIGKNALEFVSPSQRRSAFVNMVKTLRGDTIPSIELEVITKYGTSTLLFAEGNTVRFEKNGYLGTIISGIDITERKKAEESLLRSKEQYSLLADNLKDVIWSMDMELKINYMSPSSKELFGIAPEDAIGKSMMNLMPKKSTESMVRGIKKNPGLLKTVMEMLSRSINSTEVIERSDLLSKPLEYEYYCPDGKKIYVSSTMNLIINSEGKAVGICGITRDISDLKRSEKGLKEALHNLRRSNQELEQLTYIASHDLQEPLRMVASFVGMLSIRYKDKLDSEAIDFIDYAIDGVKRMRDMVDNLMAYSSVVTKGSPFESVDCDMILDRTLKNLVLSINESEAVITSDKLPQLWGDPTQIAIVFKTLIENAIEYRSKERPIIIISSERLDGNFIFKIKDNGIGIEPKNLEKVFEPFKRMNKKRSGTGIGLAICDRIIQHHGGRIWVESESGKGSTFYFTIPDKGGDKDE
ncbi:MAG: PAS domain S-box protein [Halobacteriota archaeon]|nr:PAS domain S-box protein [Halobacteriota archaeon]